jgi:hypothetical protein
MKRRQNHHSLTMILNPESSSSQSGLIAGMVTSSQPAVSTQNTRVFGRPVKLRFIHPPPLMNPGIVDLIVFDAVCSGDALECCVYARTSEENNDEAQKPNHNERTNYADYRETIKWAKAILKSKY